MKTVKIRAIISHAGEARNPSNFKTMNELKMTKLALPRYYLSESLFKCSVNKARKHMLMILHAMLK